MKISTGKKIVHFCNYSPIDSGIYPETRDLVLEELRRGYDAYILDHVVQNKNRLDPALHDDLFKMGRVIGIEDDRLSDTADLICWHSFLPEKFRNDQTKNLVMFLHGMPSFVFYNELYGGDPVLSFLKTAEKNLPHCHFFFSLWPTHEPFWENIFRSKLVVTKPIIDCDCIQLKKDNFDPNHMRLVVMDTWRGGKEPYYIFNAVQRLMALHAKGKLSAKVTLSIYGQGADQVQPVWRAIIRDEFEPCFKYMGRDKPQAIFDQNDIILTQVGEIPTESRVIREGLLAGMPIVSGFAFDPWTDFKHDCRDISGYADQILRCWNSLQDQRQRNHRRRLRRQRAMDAFDIRRNGDAIFDCYEKIFARAQNKRTTTAETADPGANRPPIAPANLSPANGPDYEKIKNLLRANCNNGQSGNCFETVLAQMATTKTMTKEEALIRLMMDLTN